jgi:hypothetical protein
MGLDVFAVTPDVWCLRRRSYLTCSYVVCTTERCEALARTMGRHDETQAAWSSLITAGGTVSRNYLLHLIERIEVRENEITIVPRPEFAPPIEDQKKNAPL